jgi:DNA primase
LGIPKYFPLIAYPKGLNLYGLQENYKYIQDDDIVFIGESEKYVLKNASREMRNCVALCCHDVTDEQIRILIGLGVTEIVIDLDKGISEYHIWSICDRLYGIRKVSYIWDKYDILEDKESSSDKPLKVNNWLRNNRIEYTLSHHKKYVEERDKRNVRP